MSTILNNISYNSQHLKTVAGPEASDIIAYAEHFAQQHQFEDHFRLIVTFSPGPRSAVIRQLIDQIGVELDLPLEKYHYNNQPEMHLSFLIVEDGTNRKGHMPSEPPQSGRGLSLLEGLWMLAGGTDVLDDHAVDMIASRYSIECVPTLYKWENRIHLSAVCPDVKDSMCGAPIVMHEISFTRSQWDRHAQVA